MSSQLRTEKRFFFVPLKKTGSLEWKMKPSNNGLKTELPRESSGAIDNV